MNLKPEDNNLEESQNSASDGNIGVFNLSNDCLDSIQAQYVRLNQSSVGEVNADSVEIRDSNTGQVVSHQFNQGGGISWFIDTDNANIQNSAAGIVRSQSAIINGNSGLVFSQATGIKDSQVGLVVSREIDADHVQSVFLMAGEVKGTVETVVDSRNIFLFGLAAGLGLGLVSAILRLFKKKR
jgi:hypothetical protein